MFDIIKLILSVISSIFQNKVQQNQVESETVAVNTAQKAAIEEIRADSNAEVIQQHIQVQHNLDTVREQQKQEKIVLSSKELDEQIDILFGKDS